MTAKTPRDEWRWTDAEGVQRLVRTDELRAALSSRILPPSTLVWREGMVGWAPASTVAELAPRPGERPGSERDDVTGPLRQRLKTLPGVALPGGAEDSPGAAPIVVPSAQGIDPGRAVITQLPRFTPLPGSLPDSPAIPRAPRLPRPEPRESAPPSASPPGRTPGIAHHTTNIDGDWGTDASTNPVVRPGAAALPTAGPNETGPLPLSTRISARPPPRPGAPRPPVPSQPPPRPGKSSGSARPAPTAPVGSTAEVRPRPPLPPRRSPSNPEHPGAPRGRAPDPPMLSSFALGARPAKPPPPARRPAEAHTEPLPRLPIDSDPVACAEPLPRLPTDSDPDIDEGPLPRLPTDSDPGARTEPLPRLPTDSDPGARTEPLPPQAIEAIARTSAQPAPAPSASENASHTFRFPLRPAEEPSAAGAALEASGVAPSRPKSAVEKVPEERSEAPRPEGSAAAQAPVPASEAATPPGPASPDPARDPAQNPAQETKNPSGSGELDAPALPPSPLGSSLQPPAPALTSERPALRLSPEALREPLVVPLSSLVAAGGALIAMALLSFLFGRCSASDEPGRAASRGVELAVLRSGDSIPRPPRPCYVVKNPARWATPVSQRIPFELASKGGALALGYAASRAEAVGLEISPSSGEITEKQRLKLEGDAEIERVLPTPGGSSFLSVLPKGSPLAAIAPVSSSQPFVVGEAGGAFVAADSPTAATKTLWPLREGVRPTDTSRVLEVDGKGALVALRRAGALYAGWIGEGRKPLTPLEGVSGPGGSLGKPAIGWNRRGAAIAFAAQPAEGKPWEIHVGGAEGVSVPKSTRKLELPKGGPGGDAFGPSLAGLPDGRWLLLWTEGPVGASAVRAQTLAADFEPIGDPLALSPPAGNFGQGALGLVEGTGYVAAVFLQRGAEDYELWGGILQCG